MNIQRLKELEKDFLAQYPMGMFTEEMKKVKKKHNLKKLEEYLKKVCSKENMAFGLSVYEDIIKVVTKSSMVSVFEKVRFRDLAREFDNQEKHNLLDAIFELIHGDEELGFNMLVGLLEPYKLAKWPLISVWRAYWNLNYDVFMKPTTVKKIVHEMEIEDITYQSKPSFSFYQKYRSYINQMKTLVDESLSPNNPAFSGFLMMTID